MAARTVLVLGGGIGGQVTANELRRRLDRDDRVVVIERSRGYLFQPSLLWLMVGRRRRERIERPLADLLDRGVELVEAEVLSIDPAARRVEISTGVLTGDAIVVALGTESDPDAMPGFREAALDIYSADGATACARALATFRGGRVVVAVSSVPYKCPAAHYEAAMLLDDELRRRGLRDVSDIDVHSPEPAPMPVAGVEMGTALLDLLESKGIRFHPGSRIERFDRANAEIVFADGSRGGYDLLAGVPPHRAPGVIGGSGLADDSGWVPVDRGTLETAHQDVYAIGDVTTITLANGKPLPRAGVFAHGEGLTAARAIAARFAGSPAPPPYTGAGYCWVETGQGRAAFADGAFFAEPDPTVALRQPGRSWHLGKVLFERSWIGGRLERRLAHAGLVAGGRVRGVRVEL
ncbi:MAG: NAD(P)/FAD-dependent oxidoreductase [Chloroflexota bacterium]